MITDYLWVDDARQWQQLADEFAGGEACLPFDSEFERTSTFYPNPSLLQMLMGDQIVLLDVQAIGDLRQQASVFDHLLCHSGSEDMEIMQLLTGRLPERVFDTQVAASLCGYGLHVSYQNLVRELLGVELDKAHSRSDWTRRPLSREQIQYAIEDVIYLPEMRERLEQTLREKEREDWFWELMENWKKRAVTDQNVAKTFIKISRNKRYGLPQQQKLFALLNWRDEQAKRRNKPRQWILKNHELEALVERQPGSTADLLDKCGLNQGLVKHHGSSLLQLLENASAIDPALLPQLARLDEAGNRQFGAFRKTLQETAERLDVPASLFASTQELKQLVAAGGSLEDLPGWQYTRQ